MKRSNSQLYLPASFLVLASIAVPVKCLCQTALGQLESWAGQSVSSVYVPSPSYSGSGNNYRVPFQKTYEQKQAEAANHYQKAMKELSEKNWEAAVRLLQKASRKDPYNNNYKNKLAEAEQALERERQANKDYQERLKREAERQKQTEERLRKIEEQRLENERQYQAQIKAKIEEAKDMISSFKKDIKYAQGHLKNYTKALQNNTGEIEKWASEIDKAYENTLENSKGYLAGMFIKYNMLQGILKRSYTEALYKRTGNLWKSSNPEIQKWFAKQLKEMDVRIDEVQDVADRVTLGGDLAELLSSDKEQAGKNLKILMFLNGVFETAHVNSYETFMKEALNGSMPGEYFEQAKMIGETYSDIAAMCYSWFKIRKINASNEEMARQISLFSGGMEQRMNEISCLEKCIKKYTDNCIGNCTGKTRWSTPPPPLLFPSRL